MEELITYKDFAKTDGFIVRSLPDHTGIAIHIPHCAKLRADFETNGPKMEISKRKHRFYHVETLNEVFGKFDCGKQPYWYCRFCITQQDINNQT